MTLDDLESQRRARGLPRDIAPQSIFIFQDSLAGPRAWEGRSARDTQSVQPIVELASFREGGPRA